MLTTRVSSVSRDVPLQKVQVKTRPSNRLPMPLMIMYIGRSLHSLAIQLSVYLPFVSVVPKLRHETLQRRCWLQRPRPSRGPGVPVKLIARTAAAAGARHHDDGCCTTMMMVNVNVGGWCKRGHQDGDSPLHGQSRRQPCVPQQLHRARGQIETQVDTRTRKGTATGTRCDWIWQAEPGAPYFINSCRGVLRTRRSTAVDR